MKLLITGGCGFLGSNLAAYAMQRGEELTIFDNLSRYGSSLNLDWLKSCGDFKFIHGDIRNTNDVNKLIISTQPDAVIHLAGQVAMTTSIANPRFDFEVNTQGTLNLLESIREHVPNAAIIYSSTNKVYGDLEQFMYEESETRYRCLDHPEGFDETITLDFHSPYGCSKGAADQYMLDYARIYGLKTVVFRHSSMYGGRQFATYDQGWIGWFCQQALDTNSGQMKEPFTISGNGKQVRDVLHAEDMQELYFKAIQQIETVQGQAFNIGGGISNSLSILELLSMLESKLNLKEQLKYIKLKRRDSDQNLFVADILKAKKMLNWVPVISKEEGISKMLSWLQNKN